MARRRSSVQDFLTNFNMAYRLGSQIAQNREINRIMKAEPEQMRGFTTDQADQLRAAAESGQYDIGIKTKEDGTFDSYTITPKADPSQTGTMGMRGVTDFLGQRVAGQMTEDQVMGARQRALAGVLMRSDPIQGMRMMREVKTQERDDQRWNRQTKQWEREDRDLAREEEYRIERDRILQETPAAQYSAAMAKYEQDQATYDAALKAGRSPEEIGPPPVRPDVQRPGPLQILAGHARLIQHDYKYGKLNTDGLISFMEKYSRVEQENYARALQVAQSGGTPEQVANAFNAAGMQIDPRNVTISRTKQANGPDQVTLNYVDGNGRTTSINVLAELTALGEAKQVYDLFFAGESNRRDNERLQLDRNADARAERADDRAAAEDARTREEAKAREDAAVALYRERNPNATPAELEAVRRGVMDAIPKVDDKAPSEVRLAQAYVEAGLYPDMRTALEVATTKKPQSAKEDYRELMRPQNGIAPMEKDIAPIMEVMHGPNWREKIRTQAGGSRAAPGTAPASAKPGGKDIFSDPRAIAIRDDPNLTMDEKRKKLRELGYQ
jgi:hypothetical protein